MNHEELAAIFFPYAFDRRIKLMRNGTPLVHYTSAEVGMSILRRHEVWLRKTGVMNDFSEVEHGFDCLRHTFSNTPTGARFRNFLNEIHPTANDELVKLFDGWLPFFRSQTFLACVSEHCKDEDAMGRLSMWRAYGGDVPIAVVMKQTPFVSFSDALRAYTSPVAYLDRANFEGVFSKTLDVWERNRMVLAAYGEKIVPIMTNILRSAVLCTKHPGFHEEREWRIIYCPDFDRSERMIHEITVVGGVPQPIYKIPLINVPEEGLTGIEPHELIERIIIGPTRHPEIVQEAFISLLSRCAVEDAQDRVVISNIPLRR
jgi:hypothetical protein